MSLNLTTRRRDLICIILITTALVVSGPAQSAETSQTTIVRAIGTSKISKGKVAGARDRAISGSLVSAVDSVVLDLIPMESLLEYFQATNEVLHGKTGGFIQGYKVLSEANVKGTYRVLVEATVSVVNLKSRLAEAGVVLGKKTLPRLLLCIAESTLDDTSPRYWWGDSPPHTRTTAGQAVADILSKRGFFVIDPGQIPPSSGMGEAGSRADLDNQNAILLADRFGADVVIVGMSRADQTGNVIGSDVQSFRATLEVRALHRKSGGEIASTSQAAVASNADEKGAAEALLKAGTLAGEALAAQIAPTWQKRLKESAVVKVIVEGTRNLGNFVLFRRALNDINGVQRIKTREMRPDTSTLMVEYSGTPRTLADELLVKTSDRFGVNITEISEEHLRVQIVSK